MKELENKDFEALGKKFWDFYSKKGFAYKNKSDVDAEIYDIICELKIIDDKQSALLIGRELNTSDSCIKKIKEERFFKHKIKDDELREQVKEIFQNNQSKLVKERIVFTVSNIASKLYIEEILQAEGKNYDYTNNPSNISMSVETFVYIAEKVGCDLDAGLKNIIKSDVVKQSLGNKIKDLNKICTDTAKTIAVRTTEALKLFIPYANLLTEIIKMISK